MDSDITIDSFIPGSELIVEIDEMCENILIVMNKERSIKGLLMSVTNKNNVIFDKLISECKELNMDYNKEKKSHSSFCVPDSTLSQNALDSNSDHNEVICAHCKSNLNKVPKLNKRNSMHKEVARLTEHGFNEEILKKKNDLSRRGTIRGYQQKPKVKVKKVKFPKNDNINNGNNDFEKEVDPNISPPIDVEKVNPKKDSFLATRHSTVRTLKTRANEKIIDLCRKRKTLKPSELTSLIKKKIEKAPLIVNVPEEKKQKLGTPRMSDASVYDFVDDDCESEHIKPYKVKVKRRLKSEIMTITSKKTTEKADLQSNAFVKSDARDGSTFCINQVLKKAKRGRPRKSEIMTSKKNPNEVDLQSSPAITFYEHDDSNLSINNVLKVKIKRRRPKSEILSLASKKTLDDVDVLSNRAVMSYEHYGATFSINNVLKAKRRRRLKSEVIARVSNNNQNDVKLQSNLGVTSYVHDGDAFSINDVVWAKIPGYPFWPARITSFDTTNLPKSYGKRCRIHWIGWHQTSYLPLKSLLHFKEHFAQKYSSKLKSLKYKHAIELACDEMKLNLDELVAELGKLSPDRNSNSAASFSKKKSINLDEIFTSKVNSRNMSHMNIDRKSCSEDEDTDEEEKARSALITVESLEANNKLSGLISKVD